MLETGLATWADFEWSLDATAHVSVNALIGLWARSKDVFY